MNKIILLFLLLCGFSACDDNGSALDYRTKDAIDSLTNKQISEIGMQMDKWCKDSFDVLVQRSVDSILKVREREIQETIK